MAKIGGKPSICPECRAEIDPRARRCRYCGSRVSRWDVTAVLGAVFALGIGAYACSHIGSSGAANSQTAIDDQTWLEQHKDDPKGLDDRFGDHAEAACSTGADDYLRGIAANDFAWDDDTKGLLGVRFNKIMTTSEGPYVLTLISDRAKLSNGFGAFSHIDLYCSYDAKLGKVRAYSTERPTPAPPAVSDAVPPPLANPPQSTSAPPPASPVDALKAQFLSEMTECQGGNHAPEDAVCRKRDATLDRLKKLGVCWDYSDWRVSRADYDWHDCSISAPPGYRFDPTLTNDDDWSPQN